MRPGVASGSLRTKIVSQGDTVPQPKIVVWRRGSQPLAIQSDSIDVLFRSVEYIRREIHPDMAMNQLRIFLYVADNEGITMPDLSERLGMPQGSLSRNIKKLSRFNEKGKMQGYDLVYREPDLDERRRFAVYLTKRGKEVWDALAAIVE